MVKPSMDKIAPPPRRKTNPVPATKSTSQSTLVPVNVRITEGHAQYLRLLSAKTRTPQRELVERAIDMLRQEAGEI